ncbi:pre-toxin TG domain-containing protein [Bacillus sp. SL00103]
MNELTGVNDAKRAATGVDPITGRRTYRRTARRRRRHGKEQAISQSSVGQGAFSKAEKPSINDPSHLSRSQSSRHLQDIAKIFDALKNISKRLIWTHRHQRLQRRITGRDMFGNKISKEQQEASMNAAPGNAFAIWSERVSW